MKIALVTGAGRGIGRSIAEHLLEKDYCLLLHANTSEGLLKNWVSAHPRASQVNKIIRSDLSRVDEQDRLIREAKASLGHLDLLVNNASDFHPCAFEKVSRAIYQRMLAINLDAPYFITQGLQDLFRKSQNPSVINIIDAMWERPWVNFSHYAISKAGLAIATRALAKELAPHIRVNAVAPGAMSFNAHVHSEDARQNILKRIPFGRLGCGQDIALAVEFLANHAPYVTGEIINIDGGRSIS